MDVAGNLTVGSQVPAQVICSTHPLARGHVQSNAA